MKQLKKEQTGNLKRVCKNCGKEFITNDSRVNYCCDECREAGRRAYMHKYYKRRYTTEEDYCETRKSDSRRFYAKRKANLEKDFYNGLTDEVFSIIFESEDEDQAAKRAELMDFFKESVKPIKPLER